MARKKRRSFGELLGSFPTLVPIMLGACSGLYLWATAQTERSHKLAVFVALVGFLGGVGTLLTLWLLQPGVPPRVQQRRRELLESLEAMLSHDTRAATQESPQLGNEALLERV